MNLEQLKIMIDGIFDRANAYGGSNAEDITVCIPVYRVGWVGGTPYTDIKNLNLGFDWNRNKLFFTPEKELREIDADEIKALRKKYDELGWKQYEITNLKNENKKLLAQVKELTEKLKANEDDFK